MCFVLFWIFESIDMIVSLIDKQLQSKGYLSFGTSLANVIFFVKKESGYVNAIRVINLKKDNPIGKEKYISSAEEIKNSIDPTGSVDIHIMTLVFFDDYDSARDMVGDDYMCWLIDADSVSIMQEEGRVEDFYGLKEWLNSFLMQYKGLLTSGDIRGIDELSHSDSEKRRLERIKKKKPIPITLILVSVNIIIYLTSFIIGDAFIESGNMNPVMINQGEYYRFFTPMFLHAGLDHLFSNMILLYFLGEIVETKIGSVKFSIIYFISGIIGNVVSYEYSLHNGGYVSVGASGAIYALLGAFVVLVIRKYKGFDVPKKRLILMIAYCIYSSFDANVDFAAHFGGLIAGAIITFVVTMGGKKREG